jgi:WD40 repeat protein
MPLLSEQLWGRELGLRPGYGPASHAPPGAADPAQVLKLKESGQLKGPRRCYGNAAAWSSDGEQLATACTDGSISIWQPNSGRLTLNFDPVSGLALPHAAMQPLQLLTTHALLQGHDASLQCIEYLPGCSSSKLVTGSSDKEVS